MSSLYYNKMRVPCKAYRRRHGGLAMVTVLIFERDQCVRQVISTEVNAVANMHHPVNR